MIVYRLVKGAPLTIAEFDGNFHDVDDRVAALESGGPEARSIDEITAVGSTLVILYTDSTEDSVPIPAISLRGRGDWAPSTAYLVNDAVTANGTVYVIPFAHTSALTFDAGANDGNGHDFYAPLCDLPELSLPPGGGTGYVLAKVSDADFDFQWINSALPVGGATGQFLRKVSSDDYDVEWTGSASSTSLEITTSTLTLTSLHVDHYLRCTHVDGCVVTVPPDDDSAIDIDAEIHFRQASDGPIVFVGGSNSDFDVTINPPRAGFSLETPWHGATATLKHVDDNEYDLIGPPGIAGSDSV